MAQLRAARSADFESATPTIGAEPGYPALTGARHRFRSETGTLLQSG